MRKGGAVMCRLCTVQGGCVFYLESVEGGLQMQTAD